MCWINDHGHISSAGGHGLGICQSATKGGLKSNDMKSFPRKRIKIMVFKLAIPAVPPVEAYLKTK